MKQNKNYQDVSNENNAYPTPTPGQISIIGSGKSWYREKPTGEPLDPNNCVAEHYPQFTCQFYTDSMMQSIKDSGCNATLAGFITNKKFEYDFGLTPEQKELTMPFIQLSLDAAEKKGMKLFISIGIPSGYVNDCTNEAYWQLYVDKWSEIAAQFGSHKGLGGWVVCDEPSYSVFHRLATLKKAILEGEGEGAKHIIFINLLPNYASIEGLNGKEITPEGEEIQLNVIKTYQDYLDKFEEIVSPEVWSYDFYPMKINKNTAVISDGWFNKDFYAQLEVFKQKSKKTGQPFWTYCDTMEVEFYNKNGQYINSLPAPTEALLSLEAFAPLCYGAQGILYWTMFLRRNFMQVAPDGSCVYSQKHVSAPFNLYGEKEAGPYSVVESVSSKIMRYNHVFYNCKVEDVKYIGRQGLPDICKDLTVNFGAISKVLNYGYGFLVSVLESNGKIYTVLLNRSVTKVQNISLSFIVNMKLITPYDGVPTVGKSFSIDVKPGDILIFEWNM